MALRVEKYGGTSVGSVERIQAVAAAVAARVRAGHQLVVVVSAMSGETNKLLELARRINPDPQPREVDVLISTGEQVTIALLALALTAIGVEARSYTGGQIEILTDQSHGQARIQQIDVARIRADLSARRVVVVAGFQGVDHEGNITTLGRGGSDTTAVALAAALGAGECLIYTDVDGVYTADPRIIPKARRVPELTFEEMLELSGAGAKVLHSRAVEFASKYQIPLRVLSSFEDGPGSLITTEEHVMKSRQLLTKPRGRQARYAGMRLFKTTAVNPRRKGSHGYNSFELIRDGMTYEAYLDAGGRLRDLKWDIDRGWVEARPGMHAMEQPLISAITYLRDEAKVTVRDVPDRPGIASTILDPVSVAGVNVDMIVQNVGADGLTDFTFTVGAADLKKCMQHLKPVASSLGAAEVVGATGVAKISLVGVGMRSHAGVAARMFAVLAEHGINIQMISTSEIKISVMIEQAHTELALRSLHKAFSLDAPSVA